jgi:hypothetical protein
VDIGGSTTDNGSVPDRRVSQRERESAVERLKPRLVDGSLSTDTFGIRVESAYAAKTKRELGHVFADLPGVRQRAASLLRGVVEWMSGPRELEPAELRLPDTTTRVELSIGRDDDCDLVLDDATVSRRHALLRRTPEGWALRDLGSTNGTRVNGWRVDQTALRPGDELTLGVARFIVRG